MNPASQLKTSRVTIGDWLLDAGAARLTHTNGEQKRLTPKALEVLLLLVSHAGTTVTREELLNTIWKASYPSDYVVSRAIADLRLAFGESAKSAGYIETVPKLGYRLIAKVSKPEVPISKHVEIKKFILIGLVALISIVGLTKLFEKTTEPMLALPLPVTSDSGLEHMSRISSSADWVVYSSLKPGHQDWDIYSHPMTGGSPKPLANTDAIEYGPALSPQDNRVAYTRISDGVCEVVVQSLYQSTPQVLSLCTTKFNTVVDWSSNGSAIAYTAHASQREGKRLINLVDPHTGEVTFLSQGGSKDSTDYYPRFSPSGKQLAFLRGTPKPDHQADLFVIDLVTNKQRQLTNRSSFHAGFTWMNEDSLLYVERSSGQLLSKTLNLNSGEAKELPLVDVFQPDYQVNQEILSFSKLRNDTDITLLKLSDNSLRHIAESTATEWHGELSPDGRWISFVSTRSGNNQLWIASLESGATRQLTQLENSDISQPRWSHNSETIAFNVKQGKQRQIFTTNIVTDDTHAFKISDDSATSARWLSNNNEFIYSCQQQGLWKLCVYDITASESNIVYEKKAFDPIIDELTGSIYFTQDKLGLWKLNRKSGKVSQVWAELPRTLGAGWTVRNNILYYLRVSASFKNSRIESRDLISGETRVIYEGPISGQNTSLGISDDGVYLVFSSIRSAQDDIIVYKSVGF
jgi:Tol biopolymer transport system component/DNA-binding winged helix-turn-helix (wHTH) protein